MQRKKIKTGNEIGVFRGIKKGALILLLVRVL